MESRMGNEVSFSKVVIFNICFRNYFNDDIYNISCSTKSIVACKVNTCCLAIVSLYFFGTTS